jgi:hypothetical protein
VLENRGIFEAGTGTTLHGQGSFVNYGQLTESKGTRLIDVPFHNFGTVDVQSGSLQFRAGGSSTGTFTVAAEAELLFAGVHTLGQPANLEPSISGGGSVVFGSGTVAGDYGVTGGTEIRGDADFTGQVFGVGQWLNVLGSGAVADFHDTAITTRTMTLQGSIISGDFELKELYWLSGGMYGSGTTTILPVEEGGVLEIPGNVVLNGRTLINQGTASWNTWSIILQNDAVLENRGIFEAGTGTTLHGQGSDVGVQVHTRIDFAEIGLNHPPRRHPPGRLEFRGPGIAFPPRQAGERRRQQHQGQPS